MSDLRLYLWQLLVLATILLYPLIRKIISPKTVMLDAKIRFPWIITLILSMISQILYQFEIFKSTEFIYIQFIVIIYYLTSGFMYFTASYQSKPQKLRHYNFNLVKKIARAYGGKNFEEENNQIMFRIITPYRSQFDGIAGIEDNHGIYYFKAKTENLRISKLILLLNYYLIALSVTENNELVKLPLFDLKVSAILASIISICLILYIGYVEGNSLVTFANDFPEFYKKALHKAAIESTPGQEKSSGSSVMSKAQGIIDRRDTNVLKAKKVEFQNKIESVFGSQDDKNIDPKMVKRVRLMNAVKRVINSTPPWKTVKLDEIATMVDGSKEEVELIISGLRDIGEIKGVYDIWTKQYHGDAISNWMQIQTGIDSLSSNGIAKNIQSLRIQSDGSTELILKGDDEK